MEMKGFKSFANKVTIDFTNDFNCILGPNGSGKSNVLDALCFVLGKAGSKSLRAEKTANLIYNGGKTKSPAKQGEVHIWFDNASRIFPTDTAEIKISRIVKKTGTSAYLINDETSTRSAISDMLAHARIDADGYNIILQGDIVRLVEMSPVERRGIIEEISGISIYEEKKDRASRELERVEVQLREADIILAERKTHLEELRKERDQAQKFKDLEDKMRRNKKTLLVRKQDAKLLSVQDLSKKISESEEQVSAIQEKISSLKQAILEKRKEIDAISREVEEKGEKEQVALMKTVEQLRIDLALKSQRKETVRQEIGRIQLRKKELEVSRKEADQKISELRDKITSADKRIAARQRELDELEKKIVAFQKKNDLASASDIDARIKGIEEQAEKLQEEMQSMREEQQELMRKKDRLEFQLHTIDEKVAKVLEAQKENKEQVKLLQTQQKQLTTINARLSTVLDRASALVPELQTAQGKLHTHTEQLNKLQVRYERIQERAAGSRAVKEVLQLRRDNPRILGTVAQLGRVSDQFSLALEVAAGGRLQSVVVEDDVAAQECIAFLKAQRLGVATFFPLNKIRSRPIPSELRSLSGPGIHGFAVDLVSFDKKYDSVFSFVFASTLVVEDIAVARRIGIGRTRMVTVQGDLIEASGAMSGGFRQQQQTGGGFVEEGLSQQLSTAEKHVADYQSLVARLTSEKTELHAEIEQLREQRHSLEDSVKALERELHLDTADLDASKGDKVRLKEEIAALDNALDEAIIAVREKGKMLASLKMEKQTLREKVDSLRSPQAIAELNAFEQQKRLLTTDIAQITTEKKGFEGNITSIYLPEQENILRILQQQDEEIAEFSSEEKTLSEALSSMQKDLVEKEKKEAEFRKQFKSLFDLRQKKEAEKSSLEEKTIREEDRIRRHEHELSAYKIQIASVKAELAGIEEELTDYSSVEVYSSKKDEDISREIREYDRIVSQFGAVNMKALEIYDRVEQEYTSLREKKEVLRSEREDVLLMINEIDTKKRELFLKTFSSIEDHFKRIFSALSTKGDAFLELENPEDPLSAGLTIRVRLSGTKFMDIRSLSGGEKTMTALAFLYAVQEHEPASFYVLDEVDAALDKKNSERLAKLLREYSKKAQYIIISHNDTIISEADALYGVSMDQHGMSQVTSLKI